MIGVVEGYTNLHAHANGGLARAHTIDDNNQITTCSMIAQQTRWFAKTTLLPHGNSVYK